MNDSWTYLLADGDGHLFSFCPGHKLGLAGVEEVELLRVAAEGGVVLLDKEPANFMLGDVVLGLACVGVGVDGSRGVRGGEVRGRSAVRGGSMGRVVRIGRIVGWVVVKVRVVGPVEGGGCCFGSHRD